MDTKNAGSAFIGSNTILVSHCPIIFCKYIKKSNKCKITFNSTKEKNNENKAPNNSPLQIINYYYTTKIILSPPTPHG